MDLILSLDTEDYMTPAAWEAQKWWADELSERGIRGSFQCVGKLIRTHLEHGRDDIIASLAEHEIGNHTDFHSRPPTHPQALADMDLEAAIEWVREVEGPSMRTLEQAFGRRPVSYCSPGDSWTPATLLAFAAMGVGTHVDCRFGDPYRPFWYCGMMMSRYNIMLEQFYDHTNRDIQDLPDQITAIVDCHDSEGVLTLFTHPTMLVAGEFWDAVFYRAAPAAPSEWRPAPLRSAREIERNKDRVRWWLDWLSRHERLRIIDHATAYAERSGATARDLPALLGECGLAQGEEGQLPLRGPNADALALLDGLAEFRYRWACHPRDLRPDGLYEQALGLAWTGAPSRGRRSVSIPR